MPSFLLTTTHPPSPPPPPLFSFQARAVRDEVAWARAVYDGRRLKELGPDVPPLADVLAATGANVTWPEFQRWVSLVASYAFHLPDDAGVTRAVFLPLLDLLNHGDADVNNCDVVREGAAFVARATRDIKAGDEVSFSYSWGQARPDHQFMHYGFLNRARDAAPHLACVDVANKTLWDCPAPDEMELGLKRERERGRGGGVGEGGGERGGKKKNCGGVGVGSSTERGRGGERLRRPPPSFPRPAAHTQPSIAHTHPPPSPTATPKDEAEAARLQAILDAFPTTEAEDLVLRQSECGLDGGHARAARTPHAPHTYARDAHCDAIPPPSPQSSPKRTGARPLSSSSGPPASAPCARPSTATVAGRRRRRVIASCEGKGRVGGGGGLRFAMAGAVVRRMCGAWVCVTQRQAAAMRRIERRGGRGGAEQEFEGGGWTVRRGACCGACGVLIAAHGRGLMCLDHRRGASGV